MIPSDCAPVVISGECNTNACPDYFTLSTCDLTTGPTVWYEFTTDGNVNLAALDIAVNAPPGTFFTYVDNVDCVNPSGFCSNDNNDGDGDALTMLDIDVSGNPNGKNTQIKF